MIQQRISKVRMVYAGKQWHIQYKTLDGWLWKSYCTTPNYDLSKQSMDKLHASGVVTTNRYAMNETVEILDLTNEE